MTLDVYAGTLGHQVVHDMAAAALQRKIAAAAEKTGAGWRVRRSRRSAA